MCVYVRVYTHHEYHSCACVCVYMYSGAFGSTWSYVCICTAGPSMVFDSRGVSL